MKESKKIVIVPPAKIEMIILVKTSYHYYRNWVKDILLKGGASKFKFLKNRANWNGIVIISENELTKAKFILKKYRRENKEIVNLWWSK